MNNQNKELNKRALFFGMNSALITVVVISIIGVINFLGTRYPEKLDLTKNKVHTFSDQSISVVKGLKEEVTATFYGDFGAREQFRPVFNNYKNASPKFKLETVDPNKEPLRAKQAGIKKMSTLVLSYKGRTSKVEDISEEKITNELIKISKETNSTVCTVIGHGEQSFTLAAAEGFSQAKKGLDDQAYGFKELTLSQEQQIPADCNALIIMGASKAFFPAEIKMIESYLDQGGRLVLGIEAAISQGDHSGEIKELLKKWGIEVKSGLIVDPISKKMGVDASVPIIAQFNPEHALTKDFKEQCYFPFARPVDLTLPAPEGIKTAWLGKSTPMSWAEMDMASITKGAVAPNPGVDTQGPLNVVAVASGKKPQSKATKETRIVVFGSAQFANNNTSRFGGNSDFFLNAVSWAIEDENMITIRAKENEPGKIELTQNQGLVIFWVCVVIVPVVIAILGIVIWVRRKKL